jgi:hypothetical protein
LFLFLCWFFFIFDFLIFATFDFLHSHLLYSRHISFSFSHSDFYFLKQTVSGTNLPNSTSSQISTTFSTAFLSTVVSTLDISSDLISIASIRFSSKRRILSNIDFESKENNEKSKILSLKSQENNRLENEKSFINNIQANNIKLASNKMIDEVGKTEYVYLLLELGVEVTSNLISTLNTAVTSGQFARQFSSNYGDTVGFDGQFTQSTVTGDPVPNTQSASNENSKF